MKQRSGPRNGAFSVLGGVCLALSFAVFFGCSNGGTGSVGEIDPPPIDDRPKLTTITPSVLTPGHVTELHGAKFPATFDDIRVRCSRIGARSGSEVFGYPFRVTPNLISFLVPTGVPLGLLTLSVRWRGDVINLGPLATEAVPQLIGYVLSDAPETPGVLNVHPITGLDPPSVILYGLNFSNGIFSVIVEAVSLDRTATHRFPDIPINVADREIAVPGVTDPSIKGVRITLPKEIRDEVTADGAVYYIRVAVRSNARLSNAIEIPTVRRDTDFGGAYQLPWPAFVSGAWVSPGVNGNLIELFYTVFQPRVGLKWEPLLELSPDLGWTWERVPEEAIVIPEDGTTDPKDFRDNLIIAGDGRQSPGKTNMAGPGTTYRLYLAVKGLEQFLDPTYTFGSFSFRLRMLSETISHPEIDPTGFVTIPTRIEGNNLELPPVAVAVVPPALGETNKGTVIEEFERRDYFLERDIYTDLDSTGLWAVNGVATGRMTEPPITGSGTNVLILEADRSYLFETSEGWLTAGRLYRFPAGAGDELIRTVRGELGTDPTQRSADPAENLDLVWTETENPGAARGELHVTRLEIPATATLYARGLRALIIRAGGEFGFPAMSINGEIDVDGLPAGEGAADSTDGVVIAERGPGGIAGPGGGNGGRGGLVRVGLVGTRLAVREAEPAEAGEWGGGAGQTMTYVLPDYGSATTKKCFVYSAPGGGGGFGEPGAVGRAGTRTDGTNNWQNPTSTQAPWDDYGAIIRVNGVGVPARGWARLIPFMAGAGGGGGGGGGGLQLVAAGPIEIGGRLSARGGDGAAGRGKPLAASGTARTRGNWSGACGGGGSGGAIVIRSTDVVTFRPGSELDVTGGTGGRPASRTCAACCSESKTGPPCPGASPGRSRRSIH